jgi:hypothetical protein
MKNLFKKRKKIESEDLIEIRKREELINQHVLIAQSLQNELRNFLGSKLSKYGLDSQKDWSFDTKSGMIKEVKRPQQNMPVNDPTPLPALSKKPVKKSK